jgi:mRNA-degrading endonuclease RelE of RelBE toxin-antitoxin system
MCEENNEIEVQQTPTFKKAYKRLSNKHQDLINDEIDIIIGDPNIGSRKKGDLSHLWVHKFKMDGQRVLLGYSWNNDKLIITLMNIDLHENFYDEASKRRVADLTIIR